MDQLKLKSLLSVSGLHCPLLDTWCPHKPFHHFLFHFSFFFLFQIYLWCGTLVILVIHAAWLLGGNQKEHFLLLLSPTSSFAYTPVESLLIPVPLTFSISQRRPMMTALSSAMSSLLWIQMSSVSNQPSRSVCVHKMKCSRSTVSAGELCHSHKQTHKQKCVY